MQRAELGTWDKCLLTKPVSNHGKTRERSHYPFGYKSMIDAIKPVILNQLCLKKKVLKFPLQRVNQQGYSMYQRVLYNGGGTRSATYS